ncbi:hypothetical protein MBLNU230_g6704t1 [Neophaeotheca triangularis]
MSGDSNTAPNTPTTAQSRWTPLRALKRAVSFSPDASSPAANSRGPATPSLTSARGRKASEPTISSPFGLRINPHLTGEDAGSPLLASRPLVINTSGAMGATPSKTLGQGEGEGMVGDSSPSYYTPSSRGAGVAPSKRRGFMGIENSPLAAAFPTSPPLPSYSPEETVQRGVGLGTIDEDEADPFVAAGTKKIDAIGEERVAPAVPSRAGTRDDDEIPESLRKQLEMQSEDQHKAEKLAGGQAYFAAIDAKDGTDQRLAELLMRNLVAGAGGEMITDYMLPGGVAFRIPSTSHLPCPRYLPSPGGGHIHISPWIPFAPRAPNPLGSHPASATTFASPPSASKPVKRASMMVANEEKEKIQEWVAGVDRDEGEAVAENLSKMKIKKMGAGLE